MIYFVLFSYAVLLTSVLITLDAFLGIIGSAINMGMITLLLFLLEPRVVSPKQDFSNRLEILTKKVHTKAKNVTFLFFVSGFVIILVTLIPPAEFFSELQESFQNVMLLIPFFILLPGLIYYNSSLAPNQRLTTSITHSILIKMDENSQEEIVMLKELIKNQLSVKPEQRKNVEREFYDKGKDILDQFLSKEYPEIAPFFFNQDFVELSSYKILEELKDQYLGRT